MEQICIYMTQKQINYVKDYSQLNKVSFNEGLRQIIEGFQKNKRDEEIKRARLGK